MSRETVDEMKQYYGAFKTRVKKQGRGTDECRAFSLTKPIRAGVGVDHAPEELARTIDAVGGDGFAIRQGIWPGYVGPFVEQVIPLLQQRGAVRTEYKGTTLREHLREF